MVLTRFLHYVAVGTSAGLVAGFVTGLGSRIAMRISGFAAGPAGAGKFTEAGFVVGEISLGQSLFLCIFGSFMGIYGGLAYQAVKPLLPRCGHAKGIIFGALMLVVLGSFLVESANEDFHLFGPPLLNVLMYSTLFLLFGMLVVPIADRLEGPPRKSIVAATGRTLGGLFAGLWLYGLLRLLLEGTTAPLQAETAGSLTGELLSGGFSFFRYHDLALSPVQVVTLLVMVYVLIVLPIAVTALSRRITEQGTSGQSIKTARFALLGPAIIVGLILDALAVVGILGSV